MHNQHAGLSQILAEQHITERHQHADHARELLAKGEDEQREQER